MGVKAQGKLLKWHLQQVNKNIQDQNGQGSVYKLTVGNGFCFCIQLTADKELRKLYRNKLRFLGTANNFEDAEEKCLNGSDTATYIRGEKVGDAIVAGGWVAVLVILISCMIGLLVGFVFGIIFS